MSVSEGFDELGALMARRFDWIFYRETVEYNAVTYTGSRLRVMNENARVHYGISVADEAQLVKATTPATNEKPTWGAAFP